MHPCCHEEEAMRPLSWLVILMAVYAGALPYEYENTVAHCLGVDAFAELRAHAERAFATALLGNTLHVLCRRLHNAAVAVPSPRLPNAYFDAFLSDLQPRRTAAPFADLTRDELSFFDRA